MDTAALHEAIRVCIRQINANLEEAARVARAAEACILAGSVAEGVEVSMDIEQLLYEAGRLHDAVCLMNRLSRD
jgi:D-alanyl-D-alanine dipeptidase